MPANPPDYRALVKKISSKEQQKEAARVIDAIDASKSAGKSEPLKQIPKHVTVLKKAQSDMKKILNQAKKDDLDKVELKEIETLLDAIEDDLKVFSKLK
jgi:hypothetical protein